MARVMLDHDGPDLAARLDELAAPMGLTGLELSTAFTRELRDHVGGTLGAEVLQHIEARAAALARGRDFPDAH